MGEPGEVQTAAASGVLSQQGAWGSGIWTPQAREGDSAPAQDSVSCRAQPTSASEGQVTCTLGAPDAPAGHTPPGPSDPKPFPVPSTQPAGGSAPGPPGCIFGEHYCLFSSSGPALRCPRTGPTLSSTCTEPPGQVPGAPTGCDAGSLTTSPWQPGSGQATSDPVFGWQDWSP